MRRLWWRVCPFVGVGGLAGSPLAPSFVWWAIVYGVGLAALTAYAHHRYVAGIDKGIEIEKQVAAQVQAEARARRAQAPNN